MGLLFTYTEIFSDIHSDDTPLHRVESAAAGPRVLRADCEVMSWFSGRRGPVLRAQLRGGSGGLSEEGV